MCFEFYNLCFTLSRTISKSFLGGFRVGIGDLSIEFLIRNDENKCDALQEKITYVGKINFEFSTKLGSGHQCDQFFFRLTASTQCCQIAKIDSLGNL